MDEIGEDRGRIRDMSLDVSVRIGETVCKVRDILALKPGQMIVLDKQAGAPADVVVKDRLIGCLLYTSAGSGLCSRRAEY